MNCHDARGGSRSGEGGSPSRFDSSSCGAFTRSGFFTLIVALAACSLAGCGLDNGPGSYIVDPGKFDALHCNDLATQSKALATREKELRNLMTKASEGGGGVVIGNLAYRSDFESVLTQEKMVQREAAEKKCNLAPAYQSDQGIR
jgi:hypothetical protein